MMERIIEQWCRPPARQQAGSGLVTVASAAGAKKAATISSSNAVAVKRRMGIGGL